jgi:hypothetical protein
MRQGVQSLLWDAAANGMDAQQKQRLDGMAWAVDQFERCFTRVIVSGQLAENELLNEQKAADARDAAIRKAKSYGMA